MTISLNYYSIRPGNCKFHIASQKCQQLRKNKIHTEQTWPNLRMPCCFPGRFPVLSGDSVERSGNGRHLGELPTQKTFPRHSVPGRKTADSFENANFSERLLTEIRFSISRRNGLLLPCPIYKQPGSQAAFFIFARSQSCFLFRKTKLSNEVCLNPRLLRRMRNTRLGCRFQHVCHIVSERAHCLQALLVQTNLIRSKTMG